MPFPSLPLAECAAALFVVAALTGLGRALFALLRIPAVPADSLHAFAAGWGAATLAVTVAAMAGVSLSLAAWAVLLTGIAGFVLWLHRADHPVSRSLLLAVVCAAPVAVTAAAVPATQFDEFSHWLPNALSLFWQDALPSAAQPNLVTTKQGYPIAGPMLTVFTSLAAGRWSETAAKAVTVLMTALLAPMLVAAVRGNRGGDRDPLPAGPTAVMVLALTLLNPFFDPRIAITTYSDTPTAVLLAAAAFALWRAGTAGGSDDRRGWLLRAGLSFAALIQLRETNLVLIGGLVAAAALTALLVRRKGSLRPDERWSYLSTGEMAALLAPAAVALLVWRLHLNGAGIGPDMAPRPLDTWDWSAPLTVMRVLLVDRLGNNPLMGGAAAAMGIILPLLAILGWRRGGPAIRGLFLLLAGLVAAQGALLTFAYIAVFSREDVAVAASAWRYAGQVGPTALLAMAATMAGGWSTATRRLPPALGGTAAATLTVLAVLAVQTAGRERWRLDCSFAGVVALRTVTTTLLDGTPPAVTVGVMHPTDLPFASILVGLVRAQASLGFEHPAVIPIPPGRREDAAVILDLSAIPTGRLNGPVTARLTRTGDGSTREATAGPPASCRR